MRSGHFASTWLLGLFLALPAPAQNTVTQVWPEVDLYLNLNPKYQWHSYFTGTRIENEQGVDQRQVVTLMNISMLAMRQRAFVGNSNMALRKHVTVSAGFSYMTPASSQPGSPGVYSGLFDATPRRVLPLGILFSARSRVELRFIGTDFSPRYRIRPQLQRDFPFRKLIFTPYADGEFYYYFSSHTWGQNVWQIGVSTQLTRWVAVDLNYNRQVNHASPPYIVNAVGINTYFYFGAK
jgi:hypothetical protein